MKISLEELSKYVEIWALIDNPNAGTAKVSDHIDVSFAECDPNDLEKYNAQ